MPSWDAADLRGLHRFSLGIGITEAQGGSDVRAALLDEAERRRAPVVEAARLDTSLVTAQKFFAYDKVRAATKKARKAQLKAAAEMSGMADMAAEGEDPMGARAKGEAETPYPQGVYRDEVFARFDAARRRDAGFGERLAQFWSNHFCISGIKGLFVLALAGPFEREAIRPHVFGRFEDMLLAVETHPAMLFYLDNQRSVGPNSKGGQKRGRGLNENLAREILELHTLGAEGGYTQKDVTTFAAVLTGWGFTRSDRGGAEEGAFFFNENLHEPGAKTVLGRPYRQDGVDQGLSVLRDIARHPSTARHIAVKLARWFVADDPPADLVALLARTFRDTDGDLGAVSAALIRSDVAWTAPATKVRTPQEFIVAASRALDRSFHFGQIGIALRAMAQPLWQPRGPNGYPSDVATLTAPSVLQARLDVSAQFARQAGDLRDPRSWIDQILGPLLTDETRREIAQAESPQQAVAIALMSPEFQRR